MFPQKETTQSEQSNSFALDKSLVPPNSLPEGFLSVDSSSIQFGTSDVFTPQDMLEISSLISDNRKPYSIENIRDIEKMNDFCSSITEHLLEDIISIPDELSAKDPWLEDLEELETLSDTCNFKNFGKNTKSLQAKSMHVHSKFLEKDEDFPLVLKMELPDASEERLAKLSKRRIEPSSRPTYKMSERPIPNASIKKDDVLFGRGKRTTNHPGNIHFRRTVSRMAPEYKKRCKVQKTAISNRIVDEIHNKGGRFLTPNNDSTFWVEVKGLVLRKKTSQALRDSIIYRSKEKKKFN